MLVGMKIACVILSFGFLILASAGMTVAAESRARNAPPDDPRAWSIRTYWLGYPYSWTLKERYGLDLEWSTSAESLNPKANPQEIRDLIRDHTETIRLAILKIGVPTPEGSLFIADRRAGLIAVRTTNDAHSFWEAMEEEAVAETPAIIRSQWDLFEIEDGLASNLLEKSQSLANHASIIHDLEKLAPQEKVDRTKSQSWISKSGQRTATESVGRSHLPGAQRARKEEGHFLVQGAPGSGLQMEVDQVLGEDRQTIDVNLHFNDASGVSHPRILRPHDSGSGPGVVVVENRFRTEVQTAMTLHDGEPRMVATWESETPGWRTMAFLTTDVILVRPDALPSPIEPWLKQHGDAVLPTPPPQNAPNSSSIPKGMSLRRYRLPHDFLSMGGGGGADEPNVSSDPFASTSRPITRFHTAKEILESQGIPFPEGSSATFFRQSGILEVVNTQESLDLIDTFTSSMLYHPPRCIDLALRIIEANASEVREWSQKAGAASAGPSAYEALKREGRTVGEYFITTKSGRIVRLDSGFQYHLAESSRTEDEEDGNTTVTTETVGMTWEIDPIIGADGYTLDLNLSIEFDTAPPVEESVGDQKIVRFFEETLLTAIATVDGQNRLIGTWTPETPPGTEKRNVMHAIFLEAHVTTIVWDIGPIDEDE